MKVWVSEHRSRPLMVFKEEDLQKALDEIDWERCLKEYPGFCDAGEDYYYVDDFADLRLIEVEE